MADLLLEEAANGIHTLTLNQPERYNTLSEAMLDALGAALARIAADDDARVVVIGAKGRAFCAGHDLREMRAHPEQAYQQALFDKCGAMMQAITALPVPVIARVQGLATAAGCQLVATCDLALASTEAQFAVSGVNLGLFCSTPAVALTRNIGRKNAFRMLMTGEFITAETAMEWGLINRAMPPGDLDAATDALATAIAGKSPGAVRRGKALFHRQLGLSLADAYADAGHTMACNMMDPDAQEGIDGFLNRRKG